MRPITHEAWTKIAEHGETRELVTTIFVVRCSASRLYQAVFLW
jgi:hypothetical protein